MTFPARVAVLEQIAQQTLATLVDIRSRSIRACAGCAPP
jgi:hypothetical protein